eukprot:6186289-Heterocapsa_arctica.AAC.1
MVDAFRRWAGQRRLPLRDHALCDNAFEIYFAPISFAMKGQCAYSILVGQPTSAAAGPGFV